MDARLREEYARIGRERDAAGAIVNRERFWFFVRAGVWMWVWCAVGLALIGASFHVQAQIGSFYFPGKMATANSFFWGGIVVGTGGMFATLIVCWRRAMEKGYLD